MSDELCGARLSGSKDEVRCELSAGHNSRHEALGGDLKWEPLYVADLRREVERIEEWVTLLRNVLDDIGFLHSEAVDEARAAIHDWDHKREVELTGRGRSA